MNKLLKTLQITGASAAMLAATAMPAFAYHGGGTNVWASIVGNGARSTNRISINLGERFSRPRPVMEEPEVVQSCVTSTSNTLMFNVNTGGNTMDGNTFSGRAAKWLKMNTGDVTIDANVANVGCENIIVSGDEPME